MTETYTPVDLGAPALRSFFGIAEAWALSEEEQVILLGQPQPSSLHAWRSGQVETVSRDTVERISYLLGIFKAINTLLPEASRADAWLRRPSKSPLFGGGSALDRMLSGNVGDLYVVRQYLDAQLG